MGNIALRGNKYNQDLKKFSCLIPISIGHALQSREYLSQTLHEIAKNFSKCTIIVADTIYRHTIIPPRNTLITPLEYSRSIGNQWIKDNSIYFENLPIPIEILHWDAFINDKNFNNKLLFIKSLYNDDLIFHRLMDKEIHSFLIRKQVRKRGTQYQFTQEIQWHIDYMQEECAVWLLWADSERFNFIIYPNKLYKPLTYLKKFFVKRFDEDAPNLSLLKVKFLS